MRQIINELVNCKKKVTQIMSLTNLTHDQVTKYINKHFLASEMSFDDFTDSMIREIICGKKINGLGSEDLEELIEAKSYSIYWCPVMECWCPVLEDCKGNTLNVGDYEVLLNGQFYKIGEYSGSFATDVGHTATVDIGVDIFEKRLPKTFMVRRKMVP